MHVLLMHVNIDSGHDSRPRMSTPPLCTGVCDCVYGGGGGGGIGVHCTDEP